MKPLDPNVIPMQVHKLLKGIGDVRICKEVEKTNRIVFWFFIPNWIVNSKHVKLWEMVFSEMFNRLEKYIKTETKRNENKGQTVYIKDDVQINVDGTSQQRASKNETLIQISLDIYISNSYQLFNHGEIINLY